MIMTSWGYTLLDVDDMPEILTQDEFNVMTANKYALDSRVPSAIKSVTAAVRNYCGWHIAGSQRCELVLNALDLQITRNYSDLLIQLPFKYISDVEKVIINRLKWKNLITLLWDQVYLELLLRILPPSMVRGA